MKPRILECCLTVSPGVETKLSAKHRLEVWEVEEALYDDPGAFALRHGDCHFVHGRTFADRCLLILVRQLSPDEVTQLGLDTGQYWIRLLTARDMNRTQRRLYEHRRAP
ncbi:MAG: hypothetical protein COZ06_33695 [Armatimonadetes bacterium CG_4_10_14_3_um_filter_66_18]|nr:MAG: hypothetical protein COZ06_33695 [Armatimonadetes bacterium CG_4_10_14_3_um_filter_66_18]